MTATSTPPVAVYTDIDDTDVSRGVRLLEDGGATVRTLNTHDPREIVAGAHDAQVLLAGYAPITREVIEALPQLRLVALMSMGSDNVDVQAATEHGVWVSNVPAAATEEVATHALALLLHAVRQLPFYLAAANPTSWNGRAAVAPRRLSETTLGLIGLGRIGRELARVAGPLFGEVVGYDPLLPDTAGVQEDLARAGIRRASLEEVRGAADVLSLHLPLTAETERLVDAAFIAAMRPGSVLVNVSRGGLVDSHAVAAALDAGQLSSAALDVLDQEPPSADHPLLGRDDVVLTPHVAYYSERTEAEYVRIQAQNALTLLRTGAPDSPVNTPLHVRP